MHSMRFACFQLGRSLRADSKPKSLFQNIFDVSLLFSIFAPDSPLRFASISLTNRNFWESGEGGGGVVSVHNELTVGAPGSRRGWALTWAYEE